jgi:hypothetical protein
METNELVLIEQLCLHHQIEVTFIEALQEFGLIEVVVVEDQKYLPYEQLKALEKWMRLHYELEINLEGIDAIAVLLEKVDLLQRELSELKNKLNVYSEAD